MNTAYLAGYRKGRADAAEAVEGLEEYLHRSKHEGGYDCCGCSTLDDLLTDAIHVARGEAT